MRIYSATFKAHMSELIKKYLRVRGFQVKSSASQYKVRLVCDFSAAMLYAIVSSVLICIQKADLVVLGMNILCSFRALISTTINASEVTKTKEGAEINKRCSSHYHDKALIQGTFFVVAVVMLCLLIIDSSSSVVKGVAVVAVLGVFANDTDNIVICAYNAKL